MLMCSSGDYVNALINYQLALKHEWDDPDQHRRICQSGMARSAIGSGDIRMGIQLAQTLRDSHLMKQCASLLEENKVSHVFSSFLRVVNVSCRPAVFPGSCRVVRNGRKSRPGRRTVRPSEKLEQSRTTDWPSHTTQSSHPLRQSTHHVTVHHGTLSYLFHCRPKNLRAITRKPWRRTK